MTDQVHSEKPAEVSELTKDEEIAKLKKEKEELEEKLKKKRDINREAVRRYKQTEKGKEINKECRKRKYEKIKKELELLKELKQFIPLLEKKESESK